MSALRRQQQQHQHLETLHSAVHALKASSPSSSEAVSCLLLQSQLHPQQHSHHAMLPPGLQDVYGSGSGTSSESCASHTHSPSVQHSTTQGLTSNPSKKGQHSSKARTAPNGSSGAPGIAGQASHQNPRDGGGGSSSSLRVPPNAVAMLHSVQRVLSKGGRNHSSSSSSTGLRRLSTCNGCDSGPNSALKGLLLQTLACRQQQQQAEQQHHLAQDGQDMCQRLLSVLRAAQSQRNIQDIQPLQPQQPQFLMRSMPPPAAPAAAAAAAAADPAGAPSAVAAAVQLLDVVGAQVSPAIAASMRQRLLQELRALAHDAAAAGLPFDVEAETRHLLPQLKSAALLAARMQKAAAGVGAGSVIEASQQQPDEAEFGAAAAGATLLLARTRTAGSGDTSSTLAAYIEGTLLAAAMPPAAVTAGSTHSRAQHAHVTAAVATAGAPGHPAGATGLGRAEPPLAAQLSRLLGLGESDGLALSTAPDMLLAPQAQQQQQQQHLSQADDPDMEADQHSSKRRRTERGARSNINCSNSGLQALKPPNSSGRTSQSPPPPPAAAAAAAAAGQPLSPPAGPKRSPPPAPGLGWQGQVPGSSPAVRVDSDGCSHDYIEELIQQELVAAMLEQLGQP